MAEDPHPIAKARFELMKAENAERETWAKVYAQQQGSIKDKEQASERYAAVIEARSKVADAVFEVERHKSRIEAAKYILEIFRTENANARAAERIR